MPDIDIDKHIDKLLEIVHREELEQIERRYRSETAECMTFARTRSLALDPSAATEAESAHLDTCPHCSARLQSFREQLHPSPQTLLLYGFGRLGADERQSVQSHLGEGCLECRRLLATHWVEKATEMMRAGRRTAEQAAAALGRAIWVSGRAPTPSLHYEGRGGRRAPFAARFERNGLSLVLEETDADELFVRVSTEDASLAHARVHIEVAGDVRPLQAEVVLKAMDSYYQGVHYFPDFSLIAGSGVVLVLAIPVAADEPIV
jgi:hypothetical protein